MSSESARGAPTAASARPYPLRSRLVALGRAIGPARGLLILGAMLIQLGTLAWIRLFVAGPDGGDICRDIVATQRILHGQSPYARIPNCGTLFNVPHPPAYFLLIGPFALLPLPWAAALWDLLGLVALWVSVALIARELRLTLSPWALALLLALLLTWSPLPQTLLEAQISPLLLLLFTLAWRWARRGRSGWVGAALGVATAVRLFPGLAIVYFLIRRDWRAVGAASVVFVGMEALATPLVGGLPGVIAYATRESPATTAEWITHEHNVSLWGFTHLIFIGPRDVVALLTAPWLAAPLTYALLAALLGALALRTYRRRAIPFADADAPFLASLPALLLASPLPWQRYFGILLLPLLVLLARLPWLAGVRGRPATNVNQLDTATDAAPTCAPDTTTPTPRVVRAGAALSMPGARWLVALLVIQAGFVWLPTLVEQTFTARPLPAVTGALAFAAPTYALLALFGTLLRSPATGDARQASGGKGDEER